MSESEDELRECPFCGSTATLNPTGLSNLTYQVVCDGCFAATGFCKNADRVIKKWNVRRESAKSPKNLDSSTERESVVLDDLVKMVAPEFPYDDPTITEIAEATLKAAGITYV